MDDALYKLVNWLSPSYPVGAFTYSHGLEWAVAAGQIADAAALESWIADLLEHGAGRNDVILLAAAWRAETDGDADKLAEVAELADALAPSAERLLETTSLGAAFSLVTGAAWGPPPDAAAYPVALGQAAAQHRAPLETTACLFLNAFAANIVSAGIRLIPLGQTDGQRVLAALLPLCRQVASEAKSASTDHIGGFAIRAEIAAMRHETQQVRLFRT